MGAHHGQHDVGSVAGRDHRHAFGQPLQHMLGGHAGDQHVHHLAGQQRFVATDHRAVDGTLQLGDRRGAQERLLGQHVALLVEPLQGRRDRRHLRRLTAIGHHRRGVGMLGGQLGQAQLDDLRDFVGGAVLGAHRQQDRRAEVHRDAGVDAEFARGGDIGVVAADDHHRVALVGHPVEPVHDVGDARRRDRRAAAGS